MANTHSQGPAAGRTRRPAGPFATAASSTMRASGPSYSPAPPPSPKQMPPPPPVPARPLPTLWQRQYLPVMTAPTLLQQQQLLLPPPQDQQQQPPESTRTRRTGAHLPSAPSPRDYGRGGVTHIPVALCRRGGRENGPPPGSPAFPYPPVLSLYPPARSCSRLRPSRVLRVGPVFAAPSCAGLGNPAATAGFPMSAARQSGRSPGSGGARGRGAGAGGEAEKFARAGSRRRLTSDRRRWVSSRRIACARFAGMAQI